MPTHKVVPTESQETLIEALVESGRYANADAVLREGLRLVEHRESIEAEKLEALRVAARLGADAIARGDYEEFANVDALVAFLDDYGDKIISGAQEP
jgi:antitoxin ParD1/3/4